jgi:hypothetical protein
LQPGPQPPLGATVPNTTLLLLLLLLLLLAVV